LHSPPVRKSCSLRGTGARGESVMQQQQQQQTQNGQQGVQQGLPPPQAAAYNSVAAYGMYPQQMNSYGSQQQMQQQPMQQQYASYGQQAYGSQGAQPSPYQTAPVGYPQQQQPQQQMYNTYSQPQQYPPTGYGQPQHPPAGFGQPRPGYGQPQYGQAQAYGQQYATQAYGSQAYSSQPVQSFGYGSSGPPRQGGASVLLQFKGRKLDSKDLFSASDPFLVISALQNPNTTRPTRSNGVWMKVHQTEVVSNDNNPVWKEFTISLAQLCKGDISQPILIECYDYDSVTSNDYIGHCVVSVVELQGESVHKLRNKRRVGLSRTAGELHVLRCQMV